jgi:hypothetical protein
MHKRAEAFIETVEASGKHVAVLAYEHVSSAEFRLMLAGSKVETQHPRHRGVPQMSEHPNFLTQEA